MKVQVCLEVGPKASGAFAPDFPGCWVFGRDRKSALHKVKTAIREWHAWVRVHGEDIESPSAIAPEPEVMRVTYDPAEAGKPEPLFWSEVRPVSRGDIDRTLRLLDYSRGDLLKLCTGLGRDALRWKPKGEPRTVYNCLRHIAAVEWWYITRLDVELPSEFPKDVFELLEYTRGLAATSLRNLSKQQRSEIFQPKYDPNPTCNLWTARKVLRRFVDHERLHTNYLRRTLRSYQE
ncbi:MAG: DinB family protein [Nitrososphaerota archaeon]|nr:DinB family protein [Nitrososphaerota archaeon]